MTKEQAALLGYQVIKASDHEVGLVKGDRVLRTWFCQDFDRKLPELDNPMIMTRIEWEENPKKNF